MLHLVRRTAGGLLAASVMSSAAFAQQPQERQTQERQARERQAPAPNILRQEIDAHLRFLSSDLLEGRAPATRGGMLAEQYIATELESYGVKPGVK